jgi:4-hydroxybenzoate polyprenyltransferase
MEIGKKRRVSEIVLGFFLLGHPIPVLIHTLGVTLFALLADWPSLVWRTLILVIVAHLAMQLSIAILNDYCDRRLDTLGKRDKPIPRGLVRPNEALAAGLLCIVIMVALLLPLNPLALIISLLYLALGQAYNLGLKSTPYSGIVFALAIPLIPVYAFVGVGRIIPFVFWLVPVAALLGVALNLANSLPDAETDAANDARTLAVVLGVPGTFRLIPLLIIMSAALVAILAITRVVSVNVWILLPAIFLTLLIVGFMIYYSGPSRAINTRKTYFYLTVANCLLLAGGWLIGASV